MENKEFNLDNVLEIVDELSKNYRMLEFAISNGEWQSMLDNLSECLKDKNKDDLEIAVNIIIRRAVHECLIDSGNRITFYYVIVALKDLIAFHIPGKTIDELKYKMALDGLKNDANDNKKLTK